MTGQSIANETFYDDPEFRLGDTANDILSESNLYKEIADDLSVSRRHEASPVDTASADITMKIIKMFPDKLPSPKEESHSFFVLQEWEGHVVSISKDTFTARLVDITRNRMIEDEEADLPIDDLDDADRKRIRPGAIFRWIIGYRRSKGGTKDRSSRIAFRNLPAWTKRELEAHQREADEWARTLNDT